MTEHQQFQMLLDVPLSSIQYDSGNIEISGFENEVGFPVYAVIDHNTGHVVKMNVATLATHADRFQVGVGKISQYLMTGIYPE